jgi:hypothetical protein
MLSFGPPRFGQVGTDRSTCALRWEFDPVGLIDRTGGLLEKKWNNPHNRFDRPRFVRKNQVSGRFASSFAGGLD